MKLFKYCFYDIINAMVAETMKKPLPIFGLCIILFFIIFDLGLFIAQHKPLWWDEEYSLITIQKHSYKDILLGHLPEEADNSPLFYVNEKLMYDLISYNPDSLRKIPGRPAQWPFSFYRENFEDPFSDLYFRIIPLIFASLSVVILFYYFTSRYSFIWGIFASLLCLTNFEIWEYGLQARPYIYFFTLTIIQVLLFIELITDQKKDPKIWNSMAIINLLLVLIIKTSAFQIFCIAIIIGYSRIHVRWKDAVMAFICPLAISFYYYEAGIKETYSFNQSIHSLLFQSVPLETWLIWGAFLVFAIYEIIPKSSISLFYLIVSMYFIYSGIMFYFLSHLSPLAVPPKHFQIRYLTPFCALGLVSAVVFSHQIVTSRVTQIWIKFSFIIFLALTLIVRSTYSFYKFFPWLRG